MLSLSLFVTFELLKFCSFFFPNIMEPVADEPSGTLEDLSCRLADSTEFVLTPVNGLEVRTQLTRKKFQRTCLILARSFIDRNE